MKSLVDVKRKRRKGEEPKKKLSDVSAICRDNTYLVLLIGDIDTQIYTNTGAYTHMNSKTCTNTLIQRHIFYHPKYARAHSDNHSCTYVLGVKAYMCCRRNGLHGISLNVNQGGRTLMVLQRMSCRGCLDSSLFSYTYDERYLIKHIRYQIFFCF